jgi:flagellar hook-associated protein 1 FlgK
MKNIFEISKSGLFAAQKSMSTASHNIANANTPGYTRQRSELSTEVLRKNGFTVGRGVSVDQVQRLRNDLTDKQIMLKEHELGDLNERQRVYQQIESVMVTSSGDDLDVATSDFFNSFSELSNNPQDKNLRNVVVTKAEKMTDKFSNTAADLADIKDRVFDSAQTKVDKVNTLLQGLADVNEDIARAEATGKPDLNSKDQQTRLLKDLSGLVTVDKSFNNDGTVEARIGGIVVLNDQNVSKIRAESGPDSNAFRLRLDNGKLLDPGKGALAADIHMFEEGIPDIQQKVDKIAASVVNQVNAIHSNGYGLNDSVSRNFFNASNTTAESISVDSAIKNNPQHIAASSVPGEAGNNDNALLISDLQNLSILDGKTLNANIVETMTDPGLKLNELEQNIGSKESARQLLVNQQQSESGVNVDEELSNLIKYQNAYQASAKVLNAGQRMYDTLLGIL